MNNEKYAFYDLYQGYPLREPEEDETIEFSTPLYDCRNDMITIYAVRRDGVILSDGGYIFQERVQSEAEERVRARLHIQIENERYIYRKPDGMTMWSAIWWFAQALRLLSETADN